MFTMQYDIRIGDWMVGMLDSVEIRRSVDLLADTATVVLPGAEYNRALEVEDRIRRGDRVQIWLGYAETGTALEFEGWVQRIGTDNGAVTIECEDDLFKFRVPLRDRQYGSVTLDWLLRDVIDGVGGGYGISCTYSWTYEKFVISDATGYDVLKKVQEECGADIYLDGGVLHVHAPGEQVGRDVYYDFAQNVQECDLEYRRADERRVRVKVKALLPDGTVKEREYGTTGGDSVEVRSASADEESMRLRGESEYKKLSFDGYEGSITTWLVPSAVPGDSAVIHDADYEYKDGKYFIQSVTTSFSAEGAARKVELGFRLS